MDSDLHAPTGQQERSPGRGKPADLERLLLGRLIADAAKPFADVESPAFKALFDRFGGCRVVLLGEATHGTSEFYRARAAITQRLVEDHGFTIVAAEADWPDAAQVRRWVLGHMPRSGAEPPFRRFPTWMWRNADFADFVEWLRRRNARADARRKVGFYGLDLYNMNASIAAVLAYLDRVDPNAASLARERYGCLAPWRKDPAAYGRAVLGSGYAICEEAVVAQCKHFLTRSFESGDDDFLDARQSARLVASAERYYRIMYYGGAETWNLRDRHMFETLLEVLAAGGPDAKAVVWAHNSHIGDARETEMGAERREINLGQLCREHFGDAAVLIGFDTDSGTVACATDWGGEMEVKQVRPSLDGSVEGLLLASAIPSFLLDFRRHPHIADSLSQRRPQRFIGVIYRPESERLSHYMDVSLSRQFDALLWFDRTSAVTPLPTPASLAGAVPDTFPFRNMSRRADRRAPHANFAEGGTHLGCAGSTPWALCAR